MRSSLILLTFVAGCVASSASAFEKTDPSFAEGARVGSAELYLDHPPPQPYRAVGVIRLKRVARNNAIASAQEEGQRTGCDYLVPGPNGQTCWPSSTGSRGEQETTCELTCAVLESR